MSRATGPPRGTSSTCRWSWGRPRSCRTCWAKRPLGRRPERPGGVAISGQAGVKASLPMWRADPNVRSELFNLNGMAHKIVFEAEGFIADASQDLNRFALYDQLDDNATEFTRRQMAVRTFLQPVGTFVPQRFDERYFALRSNLQGSVTSPSTEIADDLMRGSPGAAAAVANQARPARPGADHRLDRAGHGRDPVPRSRPRQFRRGDRPGRLRLPLARRRPVHDPVRRLLRRLQRGPAADHRRRASSAGPNTATFTSAIARPRGRSAAISSPARSATG